VAQGIMYSVPVDPRQLGTGDLTTRETTAMVGDQDPDFTRYDLSKFKKLKAAVWILK